MIRIAGGRFKGQTLVAPDGRVTRPTSAARREALFNILINGMGFIPERVLDLFAGTGALGFEALSQGASRCVFVEAAPQALSCLRDNIERLELSASEVCVLANNRIKEWPERLGALGTSWYPFDLILCDPPYEQGLGAKALKVLEQKKELFMPETILALEIADKEETPDLIGWERIKERTHGQGKLVLYGRGQ